MYRKTKISILAISSIILTFVSMPVFAEQWSESWGEVKYSYEDVFAGKSDNVDGVFVGKNVREKED